MTYILADYQQDVVAGCYAAYRQGHRNVMPVMTTGAGKTVVMGYMAHEYDGFGVSIAHRGELVGQMSVALAREGMRHDIIAPDSLIKTIVGAHLQEIGKSYYDARAKWKVSSVDTLLRRELPASWMRQVGMVHTDEGHHVQLLNKWGRAMNLFDNAYGLLPTATPERADGKGLGRHATGLVDAMVLGPQMRWCIENGHLTGYRVVAPTPEDLDMAGVEISSTTGDYNDGQMRATVKRSTKIVGDAVDTYIEYARGLKAIVFAVDVEHATDIARKFNERGIKAQIVSAKTPESDRRAYMRMFRTGELQVLVNVDLFGEGVDVPACGCVIMCRPTASYALFSQQFGRALRLLVSPILRAAWHTYSVAQRLQFIAESDKPQGVIIDLVGNVIKHNGPPDWRTTPWSLDARSNKKSADDAIPLRACGNKLCLQPFERFHPACPYCGWTPPLPADRSRPEFVDGDVVLYTDELMQQLFGKRDAIDGSFVPIPRDATPAIAAGCRNRHASNQASQKLLRETMQLMLPPCQDDRVSNRKFFLTFGVDTLSAKGLTSKDADELRQRIIQKVTGK